MSIQQHARFSQGGNLPASKDPAPKLAPVAPAESPDETADLLDDFLIALLGLPGDAWPDIAATLPDEVFEGIDRYLERRLAEGA